MSPFPCKGKGWERGRKGANRVDVTSMAAGSYLVKVLGEAGAKTVSFIRE
jgi:hypothetical protein